VLHSLYLYSFSYTFNIMQLDTVGELITSSFPIFVPC